MLTNRKDSVYIRWSLNERVQHWLLAISFIVLALTGFGLKYPDAWWVKPLIFGEWSFNLRGILHRIAGLSFILLGFYHLLYVTMVKRGRALLGAFIPSKKDFFDFVKNLKFILGVSNQRPEFSHFNYMEKAEYLALLWGAIIMVITGILLWFEDFTLSFWPRWTIDLLTVIHLYEAWLATLAIIVWHFYYIIFDPNIYPLNTTMLDGKITEAQMRHEYAAEWDALQCGTEKTDHQKERPKTE